MEMQEPIISEWEAQKAELEQILASALFRKCSNQAHLLRYLCLRAFEGVTEPPKEHQIAVEVLHRKEDFDERANPIVRVEAHRLRKRLEQYYSSEGSDHAVRIALDPGQYSVRFVAAATPAAEPAVAPDPEPPEEIPAGVLPPTQPVIAVRHLRPALRISIAALIVIVGAATFLFLHARPATIAAGSFTSSGPRDPSPLDPSQAVRILAGYDRASHIDPLGRFWRGDTWFSGGRAAESARQPLARTLDPTPFLHYRIGTFSYDIPLKPGIYELHLYFAPCARSWDASARSSERSSLQLTINGTLQVVGLNFAADGAATPVPEVRLFKNISPAQDGRLHLVFQPGGGYAFVNAIEIVPGLKDRLQPIRMVARSYYYTDTNGHYWAPEQGYHGGSISEHTDAVSGTSDQGLYSTERYGNFDYLIPVAEGTYALTVGMAETWFGPNQPGLGGSTDRLFDIACNGRILAKDVDIFREAGGPMRPLIKTFHGLKPDDDGRLRISFMASRNNATVSFLEITDESR